MKKAFTILLLAAAPTIWACPNLAANNPQDLSQIQAYTSRLNQVSDEQVYNKTIHSCFKENLESISWDQTVALMNSLKSASYTGQSRSAVTEQMAKEYLKANFDVTFADVAVEISNKMSSEEEGNKLINDYFKKALKRKMMNYEQLVILLNGVSSTSYSYDRWSRSSTVDRIAAKFIDEKMAEITLEQIIELATKARNSETNRNMTIEEYFNAHITTLSWEETLQLIGALTSNSYAGKHSLSQTRERMTLKWNKVHN